MGSAAAAFAKRTSNPPNTAARQKPERRCFLTELGATSVRRFFAFRLLTAALLPITCRNQLSARALSLGQFFPPLNDLITQTTLGRGE